MDTGPSNIRLTRTISVVIEQTIDVLVDPDTLADEAMMADQDVIDSLVGDSPFDMRERTLDVVEADPWEVVKS